MDEYERYYRNRPKDRDDLLTNHEVLFQIFAFDKANTRALQRVALDRETAKVLDVGCGKGPGLLSFLRWGFPAENLSGIDIDAGRIAMARARLPAADIREGDASRMDFPDASFDLVFESTMFLQITDEKLAHAIAGEMIRVTRPGGYIVIADWRYGKPGNADFSAVSSARIGRLFDLGNRTRVVASEHGALVPPVGRFLSRSIPGVYFLVQALLPFLVGQMTTVLQRIRDT